MIVIASRSSGNVVPGAGSGLSPSQGPPRRCTAPMVAIRSTILTRSRPSTCHVRVIRPGPARQRGSAARKSTHPTSEQSSHDKPAPRTTPIGAKEKRARPLREGERSGLTGPVARNAGENRTDRRYGTRHVPRTHSPPAGVERRSNDSGDHAGPNPGRAPTVRRSRRPSGHRGGWGFRRPGPGVVDDGRERHDLDSAAEDVVVPLADRASDDGEGVQVRRRPAKRVVPAGRG